MRRDGFYLGTHKAGWLGHAGIPLMVSCRTLRIRKTMPRAVAPWVLDSGGFTELSLYGEWRTSRSEYVALVARFESEIGSLAWAAPQDWMCEPLILAKTGLNVAVHQRMTVDNFREIDGRGPFIPVLQGWTRDDYLRHVDQYLAAGVDLGARPTVGLGSVCRRAATREIVDLVSELAGGGLRLHAFGVKRSALPLMWPLIASCDSLAWSYAARRNNPLPGCSHRSCANCILYARRWREGTLRLLDCWQPSFLEGLKMGSFLVRCGLRGE